VIFKAILQSEFDASAFDTAIEASSLQEEWASYKEGGSLQYPPFMLQRVATSGSFRFGAASTGK
jgi:hypothetical protein